MTTVAQSYGLSEDQLTDLGNELDAIRTRITSELGASDVDYMRRMIRVQRGFEVFGRASLYLGWLPPFWLAGAAALSVSKILDNMEIGHNVMHGQYDWTRDPSLASTKFEWDSACPGDQWRHSHNYLHHTFTNILEKDRDLGYGILRISDAQKWTPANLGNPLYALLMALLFDDAVMMHDVEIDRLRTGKKTWAETWPTLRGGLAKTGKQGLKDFVIWPALTGPLFLSTLAANVTANVVRNIWAFTIIFCGHFPSGVQEFTEAECENESKGHWYFRQMLGSANIKGGRLFHIMSGNLSFQIEHHLFPDLPARRYQVISPEVQEICQRYGLPYNTGGIVKQFGSVVGKIFRLALPGRVRRPSLQPVAKTERASKELVAA